VLFGNAFAELQDQVLTSVNLKAGTSTESTVTIILSDFGIYDPNHPTFLSTITVDIPAISLLMLANTS